MGNSKCVYPKQKKRFIISKLIGNNPNDHIEGNWLIKLSTWDIGWLSDEESACNSGDAGSIPGTGRSLQEEMATHSSILAWKIPWTW